jgi:pilus assembly protein FimV
MFWRNCVRALLLVCLLPSAAVALGLGDIHLNSALNAPLNADIDVVGATPEELADFKASLASRDAFARYGLDYPGFLSGITLQLVRGSDGHDVIHLRSADPIAEPFATLLVEVDWARGRLIREYTVLLDPPVFAQPGAAAAVAAPTAGAAARSGAIQRPAAAAPATPPAAASAAAPASAPAPQVVPPTSSQTAGGSAGTGAGGTYTVRAGDTLSSIAARNYSVPDRAARERALTGIYRANPAAFDGNMNALRSGSHLTLPSQGDLAAISPGEASAEVRSQYSAWVARAGGAAPAAGSPAGGRLRLVPPQESAPAAAPAAGAAAGGAAASSAPSAGSAASGAGASATATQQRVQQLEQQVADQQRLLNARSAELAALQAQLSRSAPTPTPAQPPAAAAPQPPAPPESSQAVQPPTQPPAPAATPNAPPAGEPASAAPPAATPAPTPAPKPAPAPASKPAPAGGGSLIDMAVEYWYVPAALVLLLIGALVLRAMRARQEEEFDRSLNRLGSMALGQPLARPAAERETVPIRTTAKPEQSFLVEESGSHEQPQFPADLIEPSTTMARRVSVDDAVEAEAPAAIEQGDPLAEADFHMAYGLYDQAADLVQIALQREPDRRDLRLKLLEVFFVWGNKDRFLQTARELAGSREQALPGEWGKILIMGRQIAPDDPLFTGSEGVSGSASAGVDINLEGGQNHVDFDLLGEPTLSARGEGVDLDLSTALNEGESTGEAEALTGAGVDFVLDDPRRGNDHLGATDITGTSDVSTSDATGFTREMPGSGTGETATVQVAAAEEAPTVEQPQLNTGINQTIRTKLDAPNRAGVPVDQTAELALDDLGLDLGALESTVESPLSADAGAPTMLANVDDEARRLMARAEAERNDREAGKPENTSGTWLFTDVDFASIVKGHDETGAPIGAARPADGDKTSQLPALGSSGLDLDLGDLGSGANGLDLDVGSAAADESASFNETQRIAPHEMAASDFEPATLSEVGTKLDLARAYMDMGDPDGARSILQEVLTEGSVAQKQEARRLMDTLPG